MKAPSRDIWLALAALGVAGAHFTFVYVFAALACARGFASLRMLSMDITVLVGILATVTALFAAPAVLFLRRGGSTEPDQIATWLLRGCIAVALMTIALVAMPFLFVATCA